MSITVLDRNGEFFVYLNDEEWKFDKIEGMMKTMCILDDYSYNMLSFKTTMLADGFGGVLIRLDDKKFYAKSKKDLFDLFRKIINYKEKYGRWKNNAD